VQSRQRRHCCDGIVALIAEVLLPRCNGSIITLIAVAESSSSSRCGQLVEMGLSSPFSLAPWQRGERCCWRRPLVAWADKYGAFVARLHRMR
jgi:hypothetical protein